jgi:hypothetical protein
MLHGPVSHLRAAPSSPGIDGQTEFTVRLSCLPPALEDPRRMQPSRGCWVLVAVREKAVTPLRCLSPHCLISAHLTPFAHRGSSRPVRCSSAIPRCQGSCRIAFFVSCHSASHIPQHNVRPLASQAVWLVSKTPSLTSRAHACPVSPPVAAGRIAWSFFGYDDHGHAAAHCFEMRRRRPRASSIEYTRSCGCRRRALSSLPDRSRSFIFRTRGVRSSSPTSHSSTNSRIR